MDNSSKNFAENESREMRMEVSPGDFLMDLYADGNAAEWEKLSPLSLLLREKFEDQRKVIGVSYFSP